MFEHLRERWRLRVESRAARRQAVKAIPCFYDEPTTSDTLVLVHGFHGHYRTTWKKLPELLHEDPDLPRFDILLWAYRANAFPGAESVRVEGRRLMSSLREMIPDARSLFLVGHSMGGLVLLKGLVDELKENRAKVVPAGVVESITLFATPNTGAQAASIVTWTSWLPKLRQLANAQMRNMRKGKFVEDLLTDVTNRVYRPSLRDSSSDSERRVPITACIGLRDILVSASSARGVYVDPPPVELDHTHWSIKEPLDRKDLRYLALRNVLRRHYKGWLANRAALVGHAISGPTVRKELLSRSRHAIESRLRACRWPSSGQPRADDPETLVLSLLAMALEVARTRPTLPFDECLNIALIEFRS